MGPVIKDVNAPKEAAEALGLSYESVLSNIHGGRLGAFFVGSHARILGGDVERFRGGAVEDAAAHDAAFDRLPPMLDTIQIAEFLRVCDETTRKLLQTGALPSDKETPRAPRKVSREALRDFCLTGGTRRRMAAQSSAPAPGQERSRQ
jgi:excisionase family DNA binding protein